MNWTHAKRIAWKDMRRIGALWIVLAVFWAFMISIAAWLVLRNGTAHPFYYHPSFLAGMIATVFLYGAGWAGVTFAVEHEEKSYGFLRSLPVAPESVYAGKFAFGISSLLAMVVFLAGLGKFYCWVVQRSVPHEYSPSIDGWAMIVAPLSFTVAVGLFWSLRLKRTMAAIGATVATFFVLWFFGSILIEGIANRPVNQGGNFTPKLSLNHRELRLVLGRAFTTITIVASLVLFAATFFRSKHWLTGPASPKLSKRASRKVLNTKLATGPARSNVARMLWLHIKRNRLPLFVLAVATVWFTSVAWRLFNLASVAKPFNKIEAAFESRALPFIGLLAVAMGMTTFRREHQDGRFRLLARYGAKPFAYWITAIAMPLLATVAIATVCASSLLLADFVPRDQFRSPTWSAILPICLAAFSLSQFCSIAWRSTVLSWSATIISCFVGLVWIYPCVTLGVPAPLYCWPIIILPLIASYLRVSRWFRETGSWKQWIVPAVPLLFFAFVPPAVLIDRGYEIPVTKIPDGLLGLPPLTDEDRQGVRELNEAIALLQDEPSINVSDSEDGDEALRLWCKENPAAIKQLCDAINTGNTLHTDYQPTTMSQHVGPDRTKTTSSVTRVLLTAAQQAALEGDLEESWDLYATALRLARRCNDGFSGFDGLVAANQIEPVICQEIVAWAMNKDITADRIEQAALFLDDRRTSQPPWTDALVGEYVAAKKVVDDREQFLKLGLVRWNQRIVAGLASFSPWEQLRSQRVVDVMFDAANSRLSETQELLGSGHFYAESMDSFYRLEETTFAAPFATRLIPGEFFRVENVRRGIINQLAAIAYHKQHGEYPTDLSDLKIGDRSLPTDTYNPTENMQIGPDPIHITSWQDQMGVPGLYVYSNPSPEAWQRRFFHLSLDHGHDANRPFVLPNFDDWNRQKYFERVEATSAEGRRATQRKQIEAAENEFQSKAK